MSTAENQPGAEPFSEDKEYILEILRSQTRAWNSRNADEYAKHFAADGSFTNILGAFAVGKEIFHAKHHQIFNGVYSKSTFQQELLLLKFVRPDVAVVETMVSVTGFPKLGPFQVLHTNEEGRFHTCLLQVMVKDEKCWSIAAYHNVDLKAGIQPARANSISCASTD